MSVRDYLETHPRQLLYFAIGLTGASCITALTAWAGMYQWHIPFKSLYTLFPVLGLLAFSIMWSQYMLEALQNLTHHTVNIKRYFTTTSMFVLVLILLHPGLLIIQRFVDGYGLPPESYKSYVAPMKAWITVLGSISLLAFLAFELKRFYGDRNWWPYVLILNDIAIIAIFYHGLRLGSDTQAGWFKGLWYFFGMTLVAALVYKYYLKIIARSLRTSD
jgi:hypothetical protein